MAWVIDTTHTQVEFVVKHMMIANVRGRFKSYSGTLDINAENPAASSAHIEIDVASLDTHEANRDNHLRSADFFDAENHPKIVFQSKRVELTDGTDSFRLIGDLTIRGVTREVALDVTKEGEGKDPWGNRRYGFSAHTKLNRKDYGLVWNVALETGGWLVGEEVKINIDLEVIEQVPQTAAPAGEAAQQA
jgi:polyisoprenoid-binding protein YceI